jgi:hypothetical protein
MRKRAVPRKRVVPTRRRREATLPELEKALRQTEADHAENEVAIPALADAVREADRLDADIALGHVELGAARAVQNEARAALRAAVNLRENLAKTAEALRVRSLAVVDAEQEQLRATVGDELAVIDVEVADLDRQREARLQERAAVEARYVQSWESIEASRRRFDPAAAAAHSQHQDAERQMVLSAVRGGTVGLLPDHLQARAEQERERLAQESKESLARSLERNHAEHAERGITLNAGA